MSVRSPPSFPFTCRRSSSGRSEPKSLSSRPSLALAPPPVGWYCATICTRDATAKCSIATRAAALCTCSRYPDVLKAREKSILDTSSFDAGKVFSILNTAGVPLSAHADGLEETKDRA